MSCVPWAQERCHPFHSYIRGLDVTTNVRKDHTQAALQSRQSQEPISRTHQKEEGGGGGGEVQESRDSLNQEI